VAAENKKNARMIPQTTCVDLAASHNDIFSPYVLSSSTASYPCSRLQDPRLAKKEIPLIIIHFRFLPEKRVPSFKMMIDIALNIAAHAFFPLNKVMTTSHKTPRATYLRPEFHPGGVVFVVLMVT